MRNHQKLGKIKVFKKIILNSTKWLGFGHLNPSLIIGQWVIYWNDNKHPGNEIIFTAASAGFTKCPTEIEAKTWKFSFAWGRFIKSIKCA